MKSEFNKTARCISFSFAVLSTLAITATTSAYADGCAPGQPCWEENNVPRRTQRAPIQRRVVEPEVQQEIIEEVIEEPVVVETSGGDLNLGISGGVNVFYFNCEDTMVAPSLMVDYQPDSSLPINLRLGVEGGSLDAEQYYHTPESQFFQDKLDLSFIRVPLSIEYILKSSEDTKAFIGGGPSLLMIDGDSDVGGVDVDDTDVGLHLAVRVQQAVSDNIAVSLEGGYLFSEMEADNSDFDAEGAYTGVHLVGTLD